LDFSRVGFAGDDGLNVIEVKPLIVFNTQAGIDLKQMVGSLPEVMVSDQKTFLLSG
jgi:hypothetical protein